MINGNYYGLYVVEEDVGRRVIEQFFPGNDEGDLWEGGEIPETNKTTANPARMEAFWAATDLAAVSAIVDVPGSLTTWASEALLNDADGYYGGFHNFLLYDQGQQGLRVSPEGHRLDVRLAGRVRSARRRSITRCSGGSRARNRRRRRASSGSS